eukprot:ctg_3769.g565
MQPLRQRFSALHAGDAAADDDNASGGRLIRGNSRFKSRVWFLLRLVRTLRSAYACSAPPTTSTHPMDAIVTEMTGLLNGSAQLTDPVDAERGESTAAASADVAHPASAKRPYASAAAAAAGHQC